LPLIEVVSRGIVCQPTMLNGAAAYRLTMPIALDRFMTTIVPGYK
jgi:hypothetical protein